MASSNSTAAANANANANANAAAPSPNPSQSGRGRGGRHNNNNNYNNNNNNGRGGGRGAGGGGRQQSYGQQGGRHHHPHPQHHTRASVSGRGIVDQGPSGSGGRPSQQLPKSTEIAPSSGVPYGYVPAYLPGSASLVEQLDQRLLIVLRDGRHLVGIFRSFDQFSNMVLEHTSERRVWISPSTQQTFYADVPLGLYVVRGDSMVLMGQMTLDEQDESNMTKVTPEELEEKQKLSSSSSSSQDQEDELEWDFDNDLVA